MQPLYAILALFALVLPAPYALALFPAALGAQNLVLAYLIEGGDLPVTKVRPTDIMVLIIGLKSIVRAYSSGGPVFKPLLFLTLPVYVAIGVFVAQWLESEMGAGYAFQCRITGVRFCGDIALMIFMANTVRDLKTARNAFYILAGTHTLLAAIQWGNLVGYKIGFTIGEVQGLERGVPRFFGPIGDSIGYLLIYGYLLTLQRRNAIGIGFFLGGILLTGTLGAVLATGCATAVSLVLTQGSKGGGIGRFKQLSFLFAAFAVAATALAIWLPETFESITTRITGGGGGVSQRVETMNVAMNAIGVHPFTGVGYMGFADAAVHFGGVETFGEKTGAYSNANNQVLQTLVDSGPAGLLAVGLFLWAAWRILGAASEESVSGSTAPFFRAGRAWLLAQIAGNLSTAWLIPSSSIAAFLFLLTGMAAAVVTMDERKRAAETKPELSPAALARGRSLA